LRGPARFEPRLRALVLPLFVALVLTRRLADIAAITLWRRYPCGKLVGKGGQGVALARSGLGLWPAWKIVMLRIRPCPRPRSTIGIGL
jgi:hypothetical protein